MQFWHIALGGAALGGVALLLGGGVGASAPACGIHGPVAPKDIREALLDAWAARGYPRDEASRAITLESGWHAHALGCVDGRPVAAGMVQMIGTVLVTVGFRGGPGAFAALSAAEQLPYCVKLVSRLPRWGAPGDAHLALFWPSAVAQPDDYLIAASGSTGFAHAVWVQNPSLRDGPEGPITAGSVRRTVLA